MRKIILLPALIISSVCSAQLQKPLNLADSIEGLIQHDMPTADVGISIKDAESGKIIYEHLSYHAFTPASNTKLFSSAAALYQLGENYTFKTTVSADSSKINGKTLNGDLYITFSGDPSFSTSHLKKLIADTAQNITKVEGNVIIDTSQFSGPVYGPGWSQEDLNWYFNAPVSSVIINENRVDIDIIPSPTLGSPTNTRVVDKDFNNFFKVNSDITTVTYEAAESHCSLYPVQDYNNQFNITGCWPVSKAAKTLHFAVKNPELLAKQLIQQELKNNHISVSGNVTIGRAPKKLPVVASHTSRPLKLLLQTLLKDSNNIYADALTKTLGKVVYDKGTLQEGVNAIQSILRAKANLDFDKIVLKDGCGSSRYTLISPDQITRLLFVVHHSPQIAKLYEQALPESGEDGTLKHRMTSFDLKGKMFAKTGSMEGVSSLSGYITTRDNQQFVFSILVNHFIGDLNSARMLQSKIASIIYSGTGESV